MEEISKNRLTIKMMVAIIVMLIVGIILRWDYIASELQDSWQRMFP